MTTFKPTEHALTNFEQSVFFSAWLAWKDINHPEFKPVFKFIWDEISNEVLSLCTRCGYPIRLQNNAFTLIPDKTICFIPKVNGFLINIWHLLFCSNKDQQVIIKLPVYLA